MNRFKISLLLAIALFMSGCVADQVEYESRRIALDQNAEPPGIAGPQSAASVALLLPATGPTYVTLTIFQPDSTNGLFLRDSHASPITSGSGFMVTNDGYILTAAHVAVAKGNEVSARAANGRVYSGTVVGVLTDNDMALVKLRGFSGRSVTPASAGCVAKGEMIYTLGKPHGMSDTARIGMMQSRHFSRSVSYGKFGYPDALVLHMGTQRGESGGPVFNAQGQLIGMVVSTLSDETGQSINTAHAIPSNKLGQFLCSITSCSARWASVARSTVDGCNGDAAL